MKITRSIPPVPRTLLLTGAAMLLPAVVMVGFLFRENSMRDMLAVQTQAETAAKLFVALADTRAQSDLATLGVLATSRFFLDGNFEGAAVRAIGAMQIVEGWETVVLRDAARSVTLFSVSSEGPVPTGNPVELPDLLEGGNVGGIIGDGASCLCIVLQMRVPRKPDLVLTALLDPRIYQDLLMAQLPEGSVAAIVDRNGNFVARSIDYDDRVGTPGDPVRQGCCRQGWCRFLRRSDL